jgi:YidC/Oxa1 family membrane protein insertase
MWYDGNKADQTANQMWFENRSFFSCVTGARNPRSEYRGGQSNVVWAALHNQFFTVIAMPEHQALHVIARPVTLPRFDVQESAAAAQQPAPQGCQTSFEYPAVTLQPGQAVEEKISLFAGPKEYRTIAHIADAANNNADLVMGYGGFFGGFARALLLAMNWLHDFGVPYGWAIVAITVIIKTVFWPLTQASTRSMKRMQALQPQMKAIQEK